MPLNRLKKRWPVLALSAIGVLGGGVTGYTQGGSLTPGTPGVLAAMGAALGAALAITGQTAIERVKRRQGLHTAIDSEISNLVDRLPIEFPKFAEQKILRLSSVLNPDRQLSPFRGYSHALAELKDWCVDPEQPVLLFVCGASGSGKTRLTVELSHRLADGWQMYRLRNASINSSTTNLISLVSEGGQLSLLVIEKPWQVRSLDKLLVDAYLKGGSRIKLLIVLRSENDLRGLKRGESTALANECIQEAKWLRLGPEGSAEDHLRWLSDVAASAGQLGLKSDNNAHDASLQTDVRPLDRIPRELKKAAMESGATMGFITACGFTAAADHAGVALNKVYDASGYDNNGSNPRRLIADLLAEIDSAHWPSSQIAATPKQVDRFVALLITLEPQSTTEAVQALQKLTEWSNVSSERLHGIVQWVRSQYPSTLREGISCPKPLLLAHGLTITTLYECRDIVSALIASTDIASRSRLLIFCLNALSAYPTEARGLVDQILEEGAILETPLSELLPVIADVDAPESVDEVLARIIENSDLDIPETEAVLGQLLSASDSSAIVSCHKKIVRLLRERADNSKVSQLQFACALLRLGECLGATGRDKEALVQIDEAIDVYRRYRSRHARDEAMAEALLSRAAALSHLHDYLGSKAAATKAVKIFRRLSAESVHPPEHLANALRCRATSLEIMGRYETGMADASEAVEIYRGQLASRPEEQALLFGLSLTLNVQGSLLYTGGEFEEALQAFQDGIDAMRRLLDRNIAIDRQPLADLLTNLGTCLGHMHRHSESLTAFDESLSIYRSMARLTGPRSAAGSARALSGLGHALLQLRRFGEAERNLNQAINLLRKLSESEREAWAAELATALIQLSLCLGQNGGPERGVRLALEAEEELRLLNPKPESGLSGQIALAISVRAMCLYAQIQTRKAADTFESAIAGYRHLKNPAAVFYLTAKALAFRNLGVCRALLGEYSLAAEALETSHELFRQEAERRPGYLDQEVAQVEVMLRETNKALADEKLERNRRTLGQKFQAGGVSQILRVPSGGIGPAAEFMLGPRENDA